MPSTLTLGFAGLRNIGMNQRFTPGHAALKQMIQEGQLGQVYYAQTWWRRRRVRIGLWQRGDWFLSQGKSGGGPLIDNPALVGDPSTTPSIDTFAP